MMKKQRRLFATVLSFILIFAFSINIYASEIDSLDASDDEGGIIEVQNEPVEDNIQPASVIDAKDNFTINTATNVGRWNSATSVMGVLPSGQKEAFIKFTVSDGDRIYIKSIYREAYDGMTISLYNSGGRVIDKSNNMCDIDTVIPFIFVNCSGNGTQSYYVSITRPAGYDGEMPYNFSFYDRIRHGTVRATFPGKATKPNNVLNSSTVRLSTVKNSNIPDGAIVTTFTTSATMSPKLGGVVHTVTNNSVNYDSDSAYYGSGSFNYVDASMEIPAKANWGFFFSTDATAASTMSSIELMIRYEYDLTDAFQ